jgi:hypothetical protein
MRERWGEREGERERGIEGGGRKKKRDTHNYEHENIERLIDF